MSRQEINIGVEGNDGTGDSIRSSFKKVNENFVELYAVFGIGGAISFTSLADTPNVLVPGRVPFVNSDGSAVLLAEFASDKAEDPNNDQLTDTITINTSIPGKIILKSNFAGIGDDPNPILGGPLNANGNAIVGSNIDQSTVNNLNAAHPGFNFTVDDLVITKGYADNRYVSTEIDYVPNEEATGNLHYSWVIVSYDNSAIEIDSYYTPQQILQAGQGHGLLPSSNGKAVVFNVIKNNPTGLVNGQTYYIRYVDSRTLWLYNNIADATTTNQTLASDNKIFVAGNPFGDGTDSHSLTLAEFNPELTGNFLSNVTVPRESLILKQGDTFTGPIYLHDHPGELAGAGAPKEDFQAATKFYVDNTSYSSPEVLFVSTVGDDTMAGVPAGKEGTSNQYAYGSINAAARRAEEIMLTAPSTPGPYMQTITYTVNEDQYESQLVRGEIVNSSNSQTRKLLELNRKFIQKETLGYIAATFPDFAYNEKTCERDVGLIIDAIAFDINKGLFSNFLTVEAAQRYYSSVSARKAITQQLTETVASFTFAKALSESVLRNELYFQRSVVSVSKDSPATITTFFDHGFPASGILYVSDLSGMTELNDRTIYFKRTGFKTLDLYQDAELTVLFDTTGNNFTAHIPNTGNIGLRFQDEETQYADSGQIEITSITTSLPASITTTEKHFLDTNAEIEIINASGMTAINGIFRVRRVNDFTVELYTASISPVTIIDLQEIEPTPGNFIVEVTTETNHNLNNLDKIVISGLNGATQLNNDDFYVQVIDSTTIQLYTDVGTTVPVNAANVVGGVIDAYQTGGIITQNAVDARGYNVYTGGGLIVRSADAGTAEISAVSDKWDIILNIIQNGIEASPTIIYGNVYKLVISNGSAQGADTGFVDQSNPLNADVLPGKVIRGKDSNALGRIVRFYNNSGVDSGVDPKDPSIIEINPTVIEVHLLSPKDFVRGEGFEFGNYIKKKEIVIRVEAGNYYEDYPIRIMNNVSLKGDEFRRVIIQPKTETDTNIPRISQSKWAKNYFYRDNEIDSLPIARGGTPFYNQEGTLQGKFGYHYLSDVTKVINVGAPVVNPGNYTNAALIIEANKDYLVEETNKFITDKFPGLSYNTTKSRRDTGIIIDSLVSDLRTGGTNRTLETQGSFFEYKYYLEQTLETTYDVSTASYDHLTGELVVDIGLHSLEVGQYISLANESLAFSCAYDGNATILQYPEPGGTAYQALIEIRGATATTITVNVGTPPIGSQAASSVHTFEPASSNLQGAVISSSLASQLADASQEVACTAAIDNLRNLITPLLNGVAPTYTSQAEVFSASFATYDYTTGFLEITIGSHNLVIGDYIEILPGSLRFYCNNDAATVIAYPNESSPAFETKLELIDITPTTIKVDIGLPSGTGVSTHVFVSADPGGVTYKEYTAGSTAVTSVEPVKFLTNASNNILTGETAVGLTPSAVTVTGNLLDTILFVFNPDYNPPLRNDQMDVFLLADATIVRNVTVRGHGGFMCVLDPEGQVLTKSPYIQTASSFSKSINKKVFSGGMFVDAYVGNLPVSILSVDLTSQVPGGTGYLVINVESAEGQGIRLRPPQLPCPFYLEGRRYQVNAISDYDQALGTAKLYLDATSNRGNGYDPNEFAINPGIAARDMFLQTAGNRSILGNDFTQVNDLGYGLLVTNGGFSEMVSMFTYYCHAAYYALNGAEIRSLNGSNGYGNFGLVAEGADPNEIPDQVNARYDMVQPGRAYTNITESMLNVFDEPSVYAYDFARPPHPESVIIVYHPTAGRLNYRVSTLRNMSDQSTTGTPGAPGDVVVTGIKTFDQNSITIGAGFVPADGTYPDIEQVSTSGSGSGAVVTISVSNAGANITAEIVRCGVDFQNNDTVTFGGDFIGGAAGTNDLTITISAVFPGSYVLSPYVYKLDLRSDDVVADDYFGRIQEDISNGDLIEYRDSFSFQLENILNVDRLVTRPSTAVNYDESDTTTYRSTNFQPTDSFGNNLPAATTLATYEVGFDYVECEIREDEITNGYGSAQGDTRLAINVLNSSNQYSDDIRITKDSRNFVQALQPGDPGYVSGMRFTHLGKTHAITSYKVVTRIPATGLTVIQDDQYTQASTGAIVGIVKTSSLASYIDVYSINNIDFDSSIFTLTTGSGDASFTPPSLIENSYGFIEFVDVSGTNIDTGYNGTGLNAGFSTTTEDVVVFAGLHDGASAEITIAISLCRATSHDFTQIGTGSFNDSNYPNVILGDPVNPLATFYSSEGEETAAQVWERRKGRVFFVSTDQYGFFRVGKFFEVDQATGSIKFSGEIGLSNANALGFKKGVTIDEFSVDDGFVDLSASAVPTEKAVAGFISRVLGFNPQAASTILLSNKIGPGVLPLNGAIALTGSLNVGTNQIVNVGAPTNPGDATSKAYVDENLAGYIQLESLKDFSYNQDSGGTTVTAGANQVLVSTGNKIIYTRVESTGLFEVGDIIQDVAAPGIPNKTGTIVKIRTLFDQQQNADVRQIVYSEGTGNFDLDTDAIIYSDNGAEADSVQDIAVRANLGGPYTEYVYAASNSSSDISFTVNSTGRATTTQIDIKAGVIDNSNISATASIAQSKLSLNSAKLKADPTSLSQDDLGLASYISSEFWLYGTMTFNTTITLTQGQQITQGSASAFVLNAVTNATTVLLYNVTGTFATQSGLTAYPSNIITGIYTGLIGLADSSSASTGILLSKIQHVNSDTVLGRSAANAGSISQVAFSTVVSEGGGIEDSDFPAYVASNVDTLVRTGVNTYSTVPLIADGITASSAVRRTATGQVRGSAFVMGGDASYVVLAPGANATTVQLRTPGQRTMIEGQATSNSQVTVKIPDILNVGNAKVDPTQTTLAEVESRLQYNTGTPANGGRRGQGFVSTNWIYTSAIEAIDELDNSNATGTGIGLGGDTGFQEGGTNIVTFFTDGTTRALISNTAFRTDTIQSLGTNANLTLSGAGTGFVKITDQLRVWDGANASIALTQFDGYGDSNVTFNHASGRPDKSGSSGRITVNTSSATSTTMKFQIKEGTLSTSTAAIDTKLEIGLSTSTWYTNLRGNYQYQSSNPGGADYRATSDEFYGVTDYSLGTNTARWSNIYGYNTVTKYLQSTKPNSSAQILGDSTHYYDTLYVTNLSGNTAFNGTGTAYVMAQTDIFPYVDTSVAEALRVYNIDLGSSVYKFGNGHFDNTVYATAFSGTATSARYADLAENYLADTDYEEGTVMIFGGSNEVTVSETKGDRKVAGIVSTNPAHLMNSELQGDHVVALALQGRVPCKVLGKVTKGDMLVTSAIPGYAIVDNDPRIGTVLGKAVGEKTDDGKGVVEIVVGRL